MTRVERPERGATVSSTVHRESPPQDFAPTRPFSPEVSCFESRIAASPPTDRGPTDSIVDAEIVEVNVDSGTGTAPGRSSADPSTPCQPGAAPQRAPAHESLGAFLPFWLDPRDNLSPEQSHLLAYAHPGPRYYAEALRDLYGCAPISHPNEEIPRFSDRAPGVRTARASLGRSLRRLERRGLIERYADGYSLTPLGRSAIE